MSVQNAIEKCRFSKKILQPQIFDVLNVMHTKNFLYILRNICSASNGNNLITRRIAGGITIRVSDFP